MSTNPVLRGHPCELDYQSTAFLPFFRSLAPLTPMVMNIYTPGAKDGSYFFFFLTFY